MDHISPTESEAYLTKLARSTFLRLWSHPNVYRDEKMASQGDGKEVCDLLVIFENDVFIFSDKNCILREGPTIEVAWRRWYKKAILQPAKDIKGAEDWLSEHPNRVFSDKKCTQPLPIEIPSHARFHRIITCRGAAEVSRKRFKGFGSLTVTNGLLEDYTEIPFCLGSFTQDKTFFHIFDEVALTEILETLDTVVDFRNYLNAKEAFFRLQQSVKSESEEDLLGFYLLSDSFNSTEPFTSAIIFDRGHWENWLSSPHRSAKFEADRISYCWDRLIEKFSHHLITHTQYFPTSLSISESERNVRWMARESRLRRRILAKSLVDAMRNTPQGMIRRCYAPPTQPEDPYWAFLILPQPEFSTYDQYREARRGFLEDQLYVIKYLHPDATDIVGIAVDPRIEHLSEDLLSLDTRTWTDEQNKAAKHLHENRGVLKNPNTTLTHHTIYPIEENESYSSRT